LPSDPIARITVSRCSSPKRCCVTSPKTKRAFAISLLASSSGRPFNVGTFSSFGPVEMQSFTLLSRSTRVPAFGEALATRPFSTSRLLHSLCFTTSVRSFSRADAASGSWPITFGIVTSEPGPCPHHQPAPPASATTSASIAPRKPHTNHICSTEKRQPQPLFKQ